MMGLRLPTSTAGASSFLSTLRQRPRPTPLLPSAFPSNLNSNSPPHPRSVHYAPQLPNHPTSIPATDPSCHPSIRSVIVRSPQIRYSIQKLNHLSRLVGKSRHLDWAILQVRRSGKGKKQRESVEETLEKGRRRWWDRWGDSAPSPTHFGTRSSVSSEGQAEGRAEEERITTGGPPPLLVTRTWVTKGDYYKEIRIHGRGRQGIMHHPTVYFNAVISEMLPFNANEPLPSSSSSTSPSSTSSSSQSSSSPKPPSSDDFITGDRLSPTHPSRPRLSPFDSLPLPPHQRHLTPLPYSQLPRYLSNPDRNQLIQEEKFRRRLRGGAGRNKVFGGLMGGSGLGGGVTGVVRGIGTVGRGGRGENRGNFRQTGKERRGMGVGKGSGRWLW